MKVLALEAVQGPTDHVARYERAEELGADVFVLHGIGAAGGWRRPRYRVAGSRHVDRLVEAAREWHAEEGFDGVLTFAESSVVAVATVAGALGLPGVDAESAVTSRNKYLTRVALARAGVPQPGFRMVADLDAALAAAADLGWPVVLKPTLGAASNFVFRVDGPDEMRERFRQARCGVARMTWSGLEADGVALGPCGILVESFLDGREHLVEAVVWDGEVALGAVVDRVTVEGTTFDDDIHHAPTALDGDRLAEVARLVADAARAQGVGRSVLHAGIRFHDGRPHLVDLSLRPGRGGLDRVARLTAGYCPIRAALDVAAGVAPAVAGYEPTGVHIATMSLLCDAGRIESIHVPAAATGADDVLFVDITARPGDLVLRPPDGNTVLGTIATTGPSFVEAMRAAAEVAAMIDVRVVPAGPVPVAAEGSPAVGAGR